VKICDLKIIAINKYIYLFIYIYITVPSFFEIWLQEINLGMRFKAEW